MSTAIFCIAPSEFRAESVVNDLKIDGFSESEISVLFPDRIGTKNFVFENSQSSKGAPANPGNGGVFISALSWLEGITSIVIPGAGPFIATGPITSALTGATGEGIKGAMIGMGVSEPKARRYEKQIKAGNIFMSIHTNDNRAERVHQILKKAEVQDLFLTSELPERVGNFHSVAA